MTQFPDLTLFIINFLLAVTLTFIAVRFSKWLGFYDRPRAAGHKQHSQPVPIAGGTALFLTLILSLLLLSDRWPDLDLIEPFFLIGFTIIFLTGLLDDIFIFPAKLKLAGQITGSLLLVLGGWSSGIFAFSPLNIFISLIWYIGLINAFNFLDGSDGMILQTGALITLATIIFSQMSNQASLRMFSIAILGIQVGLLLFNFRPAKMFMGDGGAQVLGLLLALIVLRYDPIGYEKASSWITPILMMSLPIFDVTLVVLSRLRRGAPIASGNLDHTYHRLVQMGMKPPAATLTLALAVFASNAVAHLVLTASQYTAYGIFVLAILIGIGLIYWLEKNFQPKLP